MPRKKKDGRFINYYIDRMIYERLERYADEKGQLMTTAIERILDEHLSRYEAERQRRGGLMYCENCRILVKDVQCPVCGGGHVRMPKDDDECYLAEKDAIWTGALADVLTQHGIPFVTRNILGAGLAAKVGPMLERTKFYVPYACIEEAQNLEREFFSESFGEG